MIVSRSRNEFLFWYWRDLGKSRAKEQPNGGGGVECGVDNFSLEMEPVAVGTHLVERDFFGLVWVCASV